MNIDKANRLVQQASQRMNAGDFRGALNLANRIRNLGSDYRVSYLASGLEICRKLKDLEVRYLVSSHPIEETPKIITPNSSGGIPRKRQIFSKYSS